ncbi:transposase family protein [Candidatus Parabeggiatoa sp. HSG14]|uniref:transposase family protein n=1 Tax=Candidatus Parabeggiatoa sp. HSG14 TaxID=3055593 RepID=UPI0025A8B80D|nr:transposase family protein [Thiotrichales bacterium HSG14]
MEEAEATSFEMEEAKATAEMEAEVIEEKIEIELYLYDGTERPINRSLDLEMQKIYYCGKLQSHTLKNNLVIDISCNILFLSNTCEGKKHDKKVVNEAGYKLPEGSYFGQNTGFQGFKIPGLNIIQPKKKPRGGRTNCRRKRAKSYYLKC